MLGWCDVVFSGIPFLFYFLPVVLIVYFAVPKFLKNAVLLLSSLFFYAWGEPRYVILMILSVVVNYILGILIEKTRKTSMAKVLLAVSAVFSLGLLGYFKYADFFIENFSKITGLSLKTLNIALPIGISFYTFQILSYTIDVYRGDVAAQKSLIKLGTYISLFPQLIAGPIVRYSDIEKQLTHRTHSFEKAADGIKRFIIGLSKKVLLANTLGEMCNVFYETDEKSVLFYWLFAVGYMLQVYLDFSGYSDMAIGLGKIFGFEFMENFRYPFISKSISEFWRRWHISLGSWFRDYVYIPMGGNRVKKPRFMLNIFTVWFLTGFWHGAEWNFIIWGLYFAVFLLIEKFFLKDTIERMKGLNHIYVLFFVLISFVIFSASGLKESLAMVGGLFGAGGIPAISPTFLYTLKNYGFTVLIAIVSATPLLTKLRHSVNKKADAVLEFIEIPVLVILLLVVAGYLADGTFNPFLYFRF